MSCRAIAFGALIALGYLFTLAALGFAIKVSMGPSKAEMPTPWVFGLMMLVAVIILAIAYFIASFFTVRGLNSPTAFLSLFHALCSWSVLSIAIAFALACALTVNKMLALESPLIFMDLHLKKPNVVTKIKPEESKQNLFRKGHDNEIRLALVGWAGFLTLLLGAGSSCAASVVARRRRRNDQQLL